MKRINGIGKGFSFGFISPDKFYLGGRKPCKIIRITPVENVREVNKNNVNGKISIGGPLYLLKFAKVASKLLVTSIIVLPTSTLPDSLFKKIL